MALTKTKTVLLAKETVNASAVATRARIDLSAAYGGIVTLRINNATAPSTACAGKILISHNDTLPALGAAGDDWKQIWQFSGGVTGFAQYDASFVFGPEIRHLEVEFSGNTGQSVYVEAFITVFTL